MSQKLKPYSKYMDSGIDWIGKIPENWEVKKLKFNYIVIRKTNLPASEGNEEGKFPFFTSGESIKYVDKPFIQGEFVIVGDGGIPIFKYYNGRFSYSDHCFLLKSNEQVDSKFLFYFLIGNLDPLDVLCFQGMGLRNLDKYKFNSFFACWPFKEEQKQIVDFLDKKTTEINSLLKRDKQLIELLKEKRIALINQVVTKGLNSKVKFRDSEIDWIGKIPEGWEIEKNKHLFYEIKKLSIFGDETLLSVSDKYGIKPRFEIIGDGENLTNAETMKGYKKCLKGDLIMNIMLAWKGALGVSDYNGIVSPAYCIYRNKKGISKYFHYLFRTNLYQNQFKRFSTGIIDSRLRLYPEEFLNLLSIIPQKNEQIKIVEYLDKATLHIDKTIKKIKKRTKLLEEYKKSLIHNVVTGKVDVRREK